MASHALLFSCSNQTFGLNNCKVGRFWCSFFFRGTRTSKWAPSLVILRTQRMTIHQGGGSRGGLNAQKTKNRLKTGKAGKTHGDV